MSWIEYIRKTFCFIPRILSLIFLTTLRSSIQFLWVIFQFRNEDDSIFAHLAISSHRIWPLYTRKTVNYWPTQWVLWPALRRVFTDDLDFQSLRKCYRKRRLKQPPPDCKLTMMNKITFAPFLIDSNPVVSRWKYFRFYFVSIALSKTSTYMDSSMTSTQERKTHSTLVLTPPSPVLPCGTFLESRNG